MGEPKTCDEIEAQLWWWRGRAVAHPRRGGHSAYDGDTLWLEMDHGFHGFARRDTRLARIDAPEIQGATRPEGLRSRDRLRELCPVGREVYLRTFREQGKYGRFIADVYIVDEGGGLCCVNDMLVTEGLAVYREY